MPKLDLDAVPLTNRTSYPPPHDEAVRERWVKRLSPVMGLVDFGASLVTLKPGAWSSQRHWHEEEDELVVILGGEAMLVDDDGRVPLRVGDIAVFPKNDGNGHHIVNETTQDCTFLAIGRKAMGRCHYSDIDMMVEQGDNFVRKDGTPL